MAYDVVTVGNYTQDTIVAPGATPRRVDGGGFAYAAHAARLAGVRVASVTRLARADLPALEPLRRAGIEVFAHESPRSTCLRLEYGAEPDDRMVTVTAAADPIARGHLAPMESAAFIVNASLRGEVPLDVLEMLRAKAVLLGVDVQGFVRVAEGNGRLAHRPWEEMRLVLPLVDALKADAVEAAFLTGMPDMKEAARTLAGLGAREIVLTHAAGVAVLAGGEWFESAFAARGTSGRSGRGDTCIGAYISKRLSCPAHEATRWAAAVTSLKLEAEGPVRARTEDVLARLREVG